jgi:hypothetical protein
MCCVLACLTGDAPRRIETANKQHLVRELAQRIKSRKFSDWLGDVAFAASVCSYQAPARVCLGSRVPARRSLTYFLDTSLLRHTCTRESLQLTMELLQYSSFSIEWHASTAFRYLSKAISAA